MSPEIVVVDNYDSFTQNVVHALVRASATCHVVRSDASSVAELVDRRADGYVISPGPCTPTRAGVSLELAGRLADALPQTPLLGLCLGHQAIALAGGAELRRATVPMHGKLATVTHDHSGILDAVPSPVRVARYNSLVVDEDSLPEHLIATAWDESGDIMALRHATRPHTGLQFHPESWLCPRALPLLDAWVASTWLATMSTLGQGQPR